MSSAPPPTRVPAFAAHRRRPIAVLAPDVADRIAAGEVVERPASVVKELVENALDAGATVVEVEVREGGRALIRVSDDGHGMDRADAELAIARHATSKIRDAEDLVGVRSFGFRGEALPAIGSVSRLTIESATADGAGVAVEVSGGIVRTVRDHARQRGTTVAVESLFFNTPARQKFLRGARSEWRAVSDILTTLALVRRDVRFAVSHDGREQMRLPVAGDLRTRVVALWGAATGERLVAVDDVQGPIRVSGLVERPADVGTAGRRVFVTVNGRAVRDLGVVRAAETAYRSTISAGLRPTVLLEVELPGGEVDVNVHPAKAEVRFRDRWTVERAVERAVRRALGTEDAAASVGYVRSFVPGEPGDAAAFGTPLGVEVLRPPTVPGATPLFDDAGEAGATVAAADGATPDPRSDDIILVPPLTQFHRTYITFERPDALVLIDQHSAHERVLYERFMAAFAAGQASAQRLLFPLTMHLTPSEAEAFEQHRDLFATLGFEAEAFGGQSVVVHAVPAPHARFDAERCLRDSLAALTGDRSPSAHGRHERLAATVACKAAIKGGDLLAPDEMRALYVALARTTLPAHDVHGRATILQLSWDELDRRFGRR
ncbi:MAG: DNA mismatch repair endonuclease MutL [Gemmatimonadota bacterium]|nr:DNA mismatch repair endonuclease MutL [Gemmatimonadota bacterium]